MEASFGLILKELSPIKPYLKIGFSYKIGFLMFLGVWGGQGTSPIDGESKKILAILFSNFFDHGEAGSDSFFGPFLIIF